jgi:hypothetical protein
LRLLAVAFLAWLGSTIATSAAFAIVYGERPSVEDLLGHVISTFVTVSVLVIACYLPALWLMRRHFGPRLSVPRAVATGLVANFPALLALALLGGRADLFARGEAAWLACQFLLFGVLFGLGVARYAQQAA